MHSNSTVSPEVARSLMYKAKWWVTVTDKGCPSGHRCHRHCCQGYCVQS